MGKVSAGPTCTTANTNKPQFLALSSVCLSDRFWHALQRRGASWLTTLCGPLPSDRLGRCPGPPTWGFPAHPSFPAAEAAICTPACTPPPKPVGSQARRLPSVFRRQSHSSPRPIPARLLSRVSVHGPPSGAPQSPVPSGTELRELGLHQNGLAPGSRASIAKGWGEAQSGPEPSAGVMGAGPLHSGHLRPHPRPPLQGPSGLTRCCCCPEIFNRPVRLSAPSSGSPCSHRSELRRAAWPTSLRSASGVCPAPVWGVLLRRLLLSALPFVFHFSTWARWERPGRPLSLGADGGPGGQVGDPALPCVDAAGERGLVTRWPLPES